MQGGSWQVGMEPHPPRRLASALAGLLPLYPDPAVRLQHRKRVAHLLLGLESRPLWPVQLAHRAAIGHFALSQFHKQLPRTQEGRARHGGVQALGMLFEVLRPKDGQVHLGVADLARRP